MLLVVDLSIFRNDSSRYMDIFLMIRKSGSFEIIRKVLKNEVEVIVTRKLCLSYKFSECLMSCEKSFITYTSRNTTMSGMSVKM